MKVKSYGTLSCMVLTFLSEENSPSSSTHLLEYYLLSDLVQQEDRKVVTLMETVLIMDEK